MREDAGKSGVTLFEESKKVKIATLEISDLHTVIFDKTESTKIFLMIWHLYSTTMMVN